MLADAFTKTVQLLFAHRHPTYFQGTEGLRYMGLDREN